MTERRDGLETRRRLVDAATGIFAEHGFHDARVADICHRARANIGAVSYYFGGKEALYREAWKDAFEKQLRAHPVDDDITPPAPPRERLRRHVRSLVIRTAGISAVARFHRLIAQERRSPSGLVDGVMRELKMPSRAHMLSALRDFLGPDVEEEAVEFCELSILAQTRAIAPQVRASYEALASRRINPALIDRYADHIVGFSLAGLKEVRKAARRSGK